LISLFSCIPFSHPASSGVIHEIVPDQSRFRQSSGSGESLLFFSMQQLAEPGDSDDLECSARPGTGAGGFFVYRAMIERFFSGRPSLAEVLLMRQ
jgi:hypothetical protein